MSPYLAKFWQKQPKFQPLKFAPFRPKFPYKRLLSIAKATCFRAKLVCYELVCILINHQFPFCKYQCISLLFQVRSRIADLLFQSTIRIAFREVYFF